MNQAKEYDEREQYEEWKILHNSYIEKYNPIFKSASDKGYALIDELKSSPVLFNHLKNGFAEAYNLLIEAKKRFNRSKNRKIAKKYENSISGMTEMLDNLTDLYILSVKNFNS